jgi:phage terminase Nu1 subunit (DNA packaging protein)
MTGDKADTKIRQANLSEVARHLLLSREMVRRLVAEKIIERRSNGTFDLDAARQSYIRLLRDRRSERDAAQAALQRAKAREIELRNAEREHKLIEFEEACAALDDIVGGIVSELCGLPAAATRDLVMRRRLEQLVRDIRQRVGDRFAAQAESLHSSGTAIDPGRPHP